MSRSTLSTGRRSSNRIGPEVAVMIVNHNGLAWLPRCLSSVAKTEYPKFKVYMIDNGSTDASVAYVRENYPFINVMRFSRNLGLTRTYNQVADQTDAEYLVLLNNDTEVLEPRWLESLVRHASKEPKVAGVACKMVSMEDHTVLESVGGMGIPYWRGFTDIGKEEPDVDQYHEGFEPFSYCGGAALIRKSAFKDAGKLDDDMFLYFEDSDLSWRLRLRGWAIRYCPRAQIAHASGGSTGGRNLTTFRLYYCHRNLLRSIIKNCGSSLAWALKNYLLFTILAVSGLLVYEPEKAIAILKGMLWNLRNFRTSYSLRLIVQSRRRTSEQEILRRMYPLLPRNPPPQHEALRHILDILFEYRNRGQIQPRLSKGAP